MFYRTTFFFSRIGLKTRFYLQQKYFPCACNNYLWTLSTNFEELDVWLEVSKLFSAVAVESHVKLDRKCLRTWVRKKTENENEVTESAVDADVCKERRRSYYWNKIFNIGLHVSAVSLYNNFSLSRERTFFLNGNFQASKFATMEKKVPVDFSLFASTFYFDKTSPESEQPNEDIFFIRSKFDLCYEKSRDFLLCCRLSCKFLVLDLLK